MSHAAPPAGPTPPEPDDQARDRQLADLRDAIGSRARERTDTVERRHLEDFLAAVAEADPGEVDPGGSDHEVPPTYVACFLDEPPVLAEALAYGEGWLNGGDRFEHHHPVHLGDTLTSATRLVDVVEKRGRFGRMAILTFETDFVDDAGRTAVRHVGTRIRR